jgi:hypothetical protein
MTAIEYARATSAPASAFPFNPLQGEVVLYAAERVVVTSARLVIGDVTHAVANVSSTVVPVGRSWGTLLGGCWLALVIAGLGIAAIVEWHWWPMTILGVCMVIAGGATMFFLIYGFVASGTEYVLRLGTNVGQIDVIRMKVRARVDDVREALERAMVVRSNR